VGVGEGVYVGVGVGVCVGVGLRRGGRAGRGVFVGVAVGVGVRVGNGTYARVGVSDGEVNGRGISKISSVSIVSMGRRAVGLSVNVRLAVGVAVDEGATVGVWVDVVAARIVGVAVLVGTISILILRAAGRMSIAKSTSPTAAITVPVRRSNRRLAAPRQGSNIVAPDDSAAGPAPLFKEAVLFVCTSGKGKLNSASCISAMF